MQCSRGFLKQGCATLFLVAIVSLLLLWDTQTNVEELYSSNVPIFSSFSHQSPNYENTIISEDSESLSSKIVKTKLLSEKSSVSENSSSFETTFLNADFDQKEATKNESVRIKELSKDRTDDIRNEEKVENPKMLENDLNIDKNRTKCPDIPPNLVGRLKFEPKAVDWDQLQNIHNELLPGGEFSPHCLSDHKVFHDVDLLPEDDRNIYTCADNPRHLSVSIDKFKYKLPYVEIFGGASAMTPDQLNKVNGFSNQYWGWGGEDDDMFKRIDANKFKITRYKPTIARYTMIKHEHEESNKVNPERFNMLKKAPQFQKTDGLNNLNYTILNITSLPLMTRISVQLHHLEMVLEPEPETKED